MYIGQDDGTLIHEAESPPGKNGRQSPTGKARSNQLARVESPTRLREAQERRSRQDVLETDAAKLQRQGTEAGGKNG